MPRAVHPAQERSNWDFTVHCETRCHVQQMNVGHLHAILLPHSHKYSIRAVRIGPYTRNFPDSHVTDRRTATLAGSDVDAIVRVHSVIPQGKSGALGRAIGDALPAIHLAVILPVEWLSSGEDAGTGRALGLQVDSYPRDARGLPPAVLLLAAIPDTFVGATNF